MRGGGWPDLASAPATDALTEGRRGIAGPLGQHWGRSRTRLLLWGIAFELAISTALVTILSLQAVFHTAVPSPAALLPLLLFPLVVWGADEAFRAAHRRRVALGPPAPPLGEAGGAAGAFPVVGAP